MMDIVFDWSMVYYSGLSIQCESDRGHTQGNIRQRGSKSGWLAYIVLDAVAGAELDNFAACVNESLAVPDICNCQELAIQHSHCECGACKEISSHVRIYVTMEYDVGMQEFLQNILRCHPHCTVLFGAQAQVFQEVMDAAVTTGE